MHIGEGILKVTANYEVGRFFVNDRSRQETL